MASKKKDVNRFAVGAGKDSSHTPHVCGSGHATTGPNRASVLARKFKHNWDSSAYLLGGDLSKYLLRLFVTGASSRSGTAIANLRRICEQELEGLYELEIIDVLEFPEVAETEKILATPTLIKSLPLPLRRVIGDLSDKDKVLLGLEVQPKLNSDTTEEAKS